MSSGITPITPSFRSSIIEEKRTDGYWVETFYLHKADKVPGIIAYGLGDGIAKTSKIEFLENPIMEQKEGVFLDKPWTKYTIAEFESPVAVVAADVDQDGFTDLLICHDYGPHMLRCLVDGGHISWLRNPGRDKLGGGVWEQRYVGRWPAMHRLKAGYFTQKSFLEVMAMSVVHGPQDLTSAIPVILFQAPEKVLEALEWPRKIVDDSSFTVIHDAAQKKFHGLNGLDSLVIASREGLNWLYYADQKWNIEHITEGEPKAEGQSASNLDPPDYWGSGCVDVGRVGDDPFAYVASIDPFHGNMVCVYTKANPTMDGTKGWTRHVLDVFGSPAQLQKHGEGPGHYVVTGDFDGDGDDEFLVAMFGTPDKTSGPSPNKGVFYYKAIDLDKGLFAKYKVAEESTARIAIGNFGGRGLLDFVGIKYRVPNYYEEENPTVSVYYNDFANAHIAHDASVVPTLWDDEGLVYLPNPDTAPQTCSLDLIEVANYALSVVVLPPKTTFAGLPGIGYKVLFGAVMDGEKERRAMDVPPFTEQSVVMDNDELRTLDDIGSVLLLFSPLKCDSSSTPGKWPTAEDVPVKVTFKPTRGLPVPPLHFKKVDKCWWGAGFPDINFHNMTGFTFRFHDQTFLAHLQFWTAGNNVNCGVHNHTDASFAEIHIGLSAGTGTGGMWRLKTEYEDTPADELPKLGPEAFDKLVLPPLAEHGGVWRRDSYGKPILRGNGTVDYPFHKWQAGEDDCVDIWAAVEFNPKGKYKWAF